MTKQSGAAVSSSIPVSEWKEQAICSSRLSAGYFAWADVQADLFELCTGAKAGREGLSEITVFKNVGGGHLDLFTARHLGERLRQVV